MKFTPHRTFESIGNEFLHTLVMESVSYMEGCISQHGVTGCIFLKEHVNEAPDPAVTDILRMGCYYIFIEEIRRFVKVCCTITLTH